ncbi:hypothetical protein [Bradyrhizobium sp. dw_411]|uniref:hypothetical protein n=1 Tax=Bradyrhizobium sp. dw_411 TaxID=2720082 RepID=UPI001BCD4888|nr:hypothetical protein [Bradyrhizobium sp. dw_411]
MIVCRLIVSLTFAAVALHAGQTFAQGAFPAPLPGQAVAPASNASPVPPVNWMAPSNGASDVCVEEFAALREKAQDRGKLIVVARDRHASSDEACRLIADFGESEVEMIKYVEAHSAKCGISTEIANRLRAEHRRTETMRDKVCMAAQQAQRKIPTGPVGDFDVIR